MNDAHDAARLIAATVQRAFGFADASTRAALIEEHVATLSEPDAPAWHIARIRDRDLLLVHDRARAWIAAWDAAGEGSAREEGWALPFPIERVIVGGPPGGYVVSGLPVRDVDDRAWFEREGFVVRGTHVDLAAQLDAACALDPRVRRARLDEAEALRRWVDATFGPAWAREVTRSLRNHDRAVFVSEHRGDYVGFAAHSGHNTALGTFGPVGVSAEMRGVGLGAALTRAALDDLHVRGAREVTIPWVDPDRVAFYRAVTRGVRVDERIVLSKR